MFKIIAHTKKGHKITMCYTKLYGEESAKEIECETKEAALEKAKEFQGLYASVEKFEVVEV